MSRMRDEYYTKLEAIIQSKYTAIHPSVEWKFLEEAAHLVNDPDAEVSDISFNNIYPLYAQADIKGSSLHRNKSIQADLIQQLELAKQVINKASLSYGFPIYEVLIHTIDSYIQSVGDHLNAGDEYEILSFLDNEIKMTLSHLSNNHRDLQSDIDGYFNSLDPTLGLLYDKFGS